MTIALNHLKTHMALKVFQFYHSFWVKLNNKIPNELLIEVFKVWNIINQSFEVKTQQNILAAPLYNGKPGNSLFRKTWCEKVTPVTGDNVQPNL